jgi:ABC-type multidrug transport system ATPase subunit
VTVLSTHQADDIAAICPHVVVLLQGRVHFTGTPAELAATAAGRVRAADERNPRAHLSWRGGYHPAVRTGSRAAGPAVHHLTAALAGTAPPIDTALSGGAGGSAVLELPER